MPKLGKQFLKQEMQYLNLVKNIIRNGEVRFKTVCFEYRLLNSVNISSKAQVQNNHK